MGFSAREILVGLAVLLIWGKVRIRHPRRQTEGAVELGEAGLFFVRSLKIAARQPLMEVEAVEGLDPLGMRGVQGLAWDSNADVLFSA